MRKKMHSNNLLGLKYILNAFLFVHKKTPQGAFKTLPDFVKDSNSIPRSQISSLLSAVWKLWTVLSFKASTVSCEDILGIWEHCWAL